MLEAACPSKIRPVWLSLYHLSCFTCFGSSPPWPMSISLKLQTPRGQKVPCIKAYIILKLVTENKDILLKLWGGSCAAGTSQLQCLPPECSKSTGLLVALHRLLAKGLLGDGALQGQPNKALNHLLNFKHLTSSIEFNTTAHVSEVKHMLKRFVGLGPKRLELYKSSCDL